MAEDKTPAKMGRPPIEIDWKQFDQMCALHCTLKEIAALFFCSRDTIENKVKAEWGMTFSEYFAQKSAEGKKALRRKQLEVAMKGNGAMLIWLGKQWLDQTDKMDNNTVAKVSVTDDAESGERQEKLKRDPAAREALKEVARKLGKF